MWQFIPPVLLHVVCFVTALHQLSANAHKWAVQFYDKVSKICQPRSFDLPFFLLIGIGSARVCLSVSCSVVSDSLPPHGLQLTRQCIGVNKVFSKLSIIAVCFIPINQASRVISPSLPMQLQKHCFFMSPLFCFSGPIFSFFFKPFCLQF